MRYGLLQQFGFALALRRMMPHSKNYVTNSALWAIEQDLAMHNGQ
jgi:hypothetical protein